MRLNHLHFYVDNAPKWKNWLVNVLKFTEKGSFTNSNTHTEVVTTGNHPKGHPEIVFVLSSPLSLESPVCRYFQQYSCGVVDVAFEVNHLDVILENLVRFPTNTFKKNNLLIEPIQNKTYREGQIKRCRILSPLGTVHTLIERQGMTPILPDYQLQESDEYPLQEGYFQAIDHLVLNVGKGQLNPIVKWYESVFGFERKQSFKIQTPYSGLYSQVLIHPQSGLQFPINEPIDETSQIQTFLDFHGGVGIQHIALLTDRIIDVISQLREKNLSFINVPKTYYQDLEKKKINENFFITEWQRIKQENILVDQNRCPLNLYPHQQPFLLQTFTQPIFEKPTLFFEIIERRNQVQGFGEGNFQALFEAIEREQMKEN